MLALDRARIEAGLLSPGCEFNDSTSPYQAGIIWAVAMKKSDLIGKTALEKIKLHPPKVTVGLILEGNEVAASGMCVYPVGDRWHVGVITSATFSPYQLWEFAGVDGLQFAKTLVGNAAGKLALFRSLEATVANHPCSLLRLCEHNFRLGVQGNRPLA